MCAVGLNPGGSRDPSLYLMEYENTCPTAGGRRPHSETDATLEEQLLRYSENTENEGEEEEYLEEEVLQVDPCCHGNRSQLHLVVLMSQVSLMKT